MTLRLGIRARVAIFGLGVIVLAWVANSLFVRPRVESSVRSEQEQRIDQLAGTVGREIGSRVDSAMHELASIARLPAIRSMDPAQITAALSLFDKVSQSFLYFTVLDAHGVVLARPSKPQRVGADRSSRTYFSNVVDTHHSAIVEPAISTAGNRSMVASTPIESDDGTLIGVLTGALGLMDRNQSLYAPVAEPGERSLPVQLFLISRNGSVIASSTVLGKPSEHSVSRPPEFADETDQAATIITDVGGRWVVASYEVTPLGWTVVARVPENVVAERTADISRPYLAAAFLITAVAVGLGLVLASLLLRPIARLSRALIDYGRGGRQRPLPETGPREISEVAKAFNRMREEREALEHQLQQSQKLQTLGTFAGGIAHDFNNLLTPIVLGASALAMRHRGQPDANLAIDVEVCANRAKDLIARLLAFSREAKPQRTPVDLAEQVADALKLARFHIPANVTIDADLDDGCQVMGDPIEIQQVVLNLVTNAADAMKPDAGTLTAALRRSDDGRVAVLEVSDTGCGMSDEDCRRIFEPFFTTKPPGEGTGLGLSITRGIVHNLGGTIHVDSQVGVGTTFRIEIPTVEVGEDAAAESTGADDGDGEPSDERRHGKLLVVDDEPSVARALAITLEALGFDATVCTDPHEALERLTGDEEHYDLVITDLAMPGISGADLITRVRVVAPEQRFLVISGSISQDLPESYQGLGIGDVLAKPVSAAELERCVLAALDA